MMVNAPAQGIALSIEALDRASVDEKLAHFARKDALRMPRKPGETWGAPMRLKRDGLPSKLTPGSIDAHGGHVTRQVYPVFGRPCFGIPTARLIHGREHMIRKNGRLAFARCGECPIKGACQFIVNERLIANEEIREAHREFQRRGGAEAFWSPEPTKVRGAGAALQVLLRELKAACFTTVNDAAVAAHYDALAQTRRASDAARQRECRERAKNQSAREAGRSSSHIIAEGLRLRSIIEQAQAQACCARWLTTLNAIEVARILALKAALSERGSKRGATHIARILLKVTPGVGHDALRFRVSRVLRREAQIRALQGNQNPSRP